MSRGGWLSFHEMENQKKKEKLEKQGKTTVYARKLTTKVFHILKRLFRIILHTSCTKMHTLALALMKRIFIKGQIDVITLGRVRRLAMVVGDDACTQYRE